jgi:hypothetical protein
MKKEKAVKIKNKHLIPAYVENITKILERLASYKSQQASFTYRHPEHEWLLRPPGYQPAIESRVLEKVLKQLGALIEVDRSASKKRFIVKVQPIRRALGKKNRKKLHRLIMQLFVDELKERAIIIETHSWKRRASQ